MAAINWPRRRRRDSVNAKRPRVMHLFGTTITGGAYGMAKAASRQRRKRTASRTRRWSQRITEGSNALDLEEGVFTLESPKGIAASLKRSAERSRRRKSDPYRSAMSMLTFYINRAGKNLPAARMRTLQRAKDELRKAFGKD
jgi:hypothetical protein